MIVKVTSWTRVRAAAKATIRYLMHRPDRNGERASRALFGVDGPMEKYHGYRMIDAAGRKSVFFRLTLSPDPAREDTRKDLDLWALTQAAMAHLNAQLGTAIQFLAVAHEDQTDNRHVNALVLVAHKLTKAQFRTLPKLLRHAARDAAMLQRALLDPEAVQPEQQATTTFVRQQQQTATPVARPAPLAYACPTCGPHQALWHLEEGILLCAGCGAHYGVGSGGGLQREGRYLSA